MSQVFEMIEKSGHKDFVQAYLECAMWACVNCDAEGNMGENFDDYDFEDFAVEAIQETIEDCAGFIEQATELKGYEDLDTAQCGHDFHLTHNGHGAGFWDRGY